MVRVRWQKVWSNDVDEMVRTVRDRSILGRVWPALADRHRFVAYDLESAQQAHTRVRWDGTETQYSTAEQMHSEMVAVTEMLAAGDWLLDDDGRVTGAADDGPITVDHFRTNVPHCRFCTVALHLLGLPIGRGRATKGNYKKAAELEYRLPEPVRDSPVVLGRLLDGYAPPDHRDDCLVAVKERVNRLLSRPREDGWVLQVGDEFVTETDVRADPGGAEVLEWGAVSRRPINVEKPNYGDVAVGRFLWKLGFDGLYRAPG